MNKQNVVNLGKGVASIVASISVGRVVNNAVSMVKPTAATKIDKIVIVVGASLLTAAVVDFVIDDLMKTIDQIAAIIPEKDETPIPVDQNSVFKKP